MVIKIYLVLILILNVTYLTGKVVYISDQKETGLLTLEESRKLLEGDLNRFYSQKKLGSFVENGKTCFRLFAPSAVRVDLILFEKIEDETGREYPMHKDSNGVWEAVVDGEQYGSFYGYQVHHKDENTNIPLCLDPYAKAVATYNIYMNPRKAIVVKDDNYDWQGDEWIQRDWRDLIIYEMHIRDLTAHQSSGAEKKGTYKGLIEKGKTGGIDYIKGLGINTIELLPSQEFGNIEIPYNKYLAERKNTWNPYERNHWGYMTSSFFAPAAYYAEDSRDGLKWNAWMGDDARAIVQFKDMVKAFHKENIAVMMDVVFNHISEYESGNLKEIDSKYYFRLDDKGNYKSESGCGNDLKTERPMVRRMIIESIIYWMKEYHIDGFRFDLGRLIDWETIEEVIREARNINPNVVFVCEPWGGGYDPQAFSLREWGSWNDQIRNGIKGENPYNGTGWIFGHWYGNNNPDRIKSYVNGTLVKDKYGLFQKKEHSVNYLESHDGYTLGDFIRIGTHEVNPDKKIKDIDVNAKISQHQMKLNKLSALFLLTSQGITMISEGQEFARSKVIDNTSPIKDPHKGELDHNSYNKDNETNYLNYDHTALNKELVDYYKGLIQLRNKYSAFRRAEYEDINFYTVDTKFYLAYNINYKDQEFILLFNADNKHDFEFNLPAGNWNILVNPETAGTEIIKSISGTIKLEPKDGFVLIKSK